MGDQEMMHPENCVAHTGMEEKIKRVADKFGLVIWLLGILIGLNGFQAVMTMNIKSELTGVTIRFSAMEALNKRLEEKIQSLEMTDSRFSDRLDAIERRLK